MTLEISGDRAAQLWADEAGGHRVQRIPPGERRGRVHSSTVTVAVQRSPGARELVIPDRDIEWRATRGSGPGGQNRNKTNTCVQAVHLPTGLQVRCEAERSQLQNRVTALALLRARLLAASRAADQRARDHDRRQQVGSGQRGDKRRTTREQDGQVVDHPTGRRWDLRAYRRGEW